MVRRNPRHAVFVPLKTTKPPLMADSLMNVALGRQVAIARPFIGKIVEPGTTNFLMMCVRVAASRLSTMKKRVFFWEAFPSLRENRPDLSLKITNIFRLFFVNQRTTFNHLKRGSTRLQCSVHDAGSLFVLLKRRRWRRLSACIRVSFSLTCWSKTGSFNSRVAEFTSVKPTTHTPSLACFRPL